MSKTICILGRQPLLGLAELESLLGPDVIHMASPDVTLLDVDPESIPFSRLGGTVKIAKLIYEFPETDWRKVQLFLEKTIPEYLANVPEGKFTLGLSVYGLSISPKQLLATGLSIKKSVKTTTGRSIRLVPNNDPALNSAQIIHNKLTSPNGWELVFVKSGNKLLMGQTKQEQDIEAYAARDQKRPKRDSVVGMLPPKLAQIIINLAKPPENSSILDPFCGTGVILQEAQIMGYASLGTDIEPRMVEYAQENIEWLQQYTKNPDKKGTVTVGDATNYRWSEEFGAIACETYLGRPFTREPDTKTLEKVMQDVHMIHKKFLENVASQTKSGFRMTIAVPAWKIKQGFIHLKTLDSLEELGYTRISFVHADNKDLIYHREGQIVGRELVTLIRK
jgi:tRNA G10  N-methylase Trm11